MEHQPKPKLCRAFRILAAITAAVAVASSFVITAEPVQMICKTLAIGAILALICIADRISGERFSWSPILLAAVFIFPNPCTAALPAALFTAPLLAASFPFVLLSIETSRADFAADAAMLVTAAAIICPPAVWLLIPLGVLLASKSANPFKLLAGETAGILMTAITASCIIILAGGAGSIAERIGTFGAEIKDIGKPALSFNGWAFLCRCTFILSFLTAITLFLGYRTRLGVPEAGKMEVTAIFLFSLIPLGIIYNDSMEWPAATLFAALSAFLISDILRVTKYNKALTILLFACIIFTLVEIISEFIPEMNEVFAIFVV